jgi:colanic acid/amylovoran biosynthesis glycosyltransferase
VVLQEVQASGCVPVAFAVGGIPECLYHQEYSSLVQQKSSRPIFLAVRYLLNLPNEWRLYQPAGRAYVENNFSADVVGKMISEVLRNAAHYSMNEE